MEVVAGVVEGLSPSVCGTPRTGGCPTVSFRRMDVVVGVFGPLGDVVTSRNAVWADRDSHWCAGFNDTDLAQLPPATLVCRLTPLANGTIIDRD